ncbi:hypothetical protein EYF80_064718 [Liparis tanakae]|uniref:Uncharacterized protein n=1 Tax=Liparis tanakae TaxID=230148 RepID=A0A4Z2E8R7_9TELE|nr:hypothetical protein EYF80_064718 [Liparis tanakae]
MKRCQHRPAHAGPPLGLSGKQEAGFRAVVWPQRIYLSGTGRQPFSSLNDLFSESSYLIGLSISVVLERTDDRMTPEPPPKHVCPASAPRPSLFTLGPQKHNSTRTKSIQSWKMVLKP